MSRRSDDALWYRRLIFAVLAGGYMLVYFHRLYAAVVAVDMMHDLKTSAARLGLLSSAYFYPYALMQIPAGLLADSWGPRRTITVFFIVACAGSTLLGLAPSLAGALVGRTLVGIGVAMLFVPTMKILAEWFAPEEFARMTGLMIAMGRAGSLSAAAPLAYLSSAVSWRGSFLPSCGFGHAGAGRSGLGVVRDRPEGSGVSVKAEEVKSGEAAIGLRDGVWRVVSTFGFWPFAVRFFLSAPFFSLSSAYGAVRF